MYKRYHIVILVLLYLLFIAYYMEKKQITTYLLISKDEFSELLNQRIIEGEKIYSKQCYSEELLTKLYSLLHNWDTFNSIILKTSFDPPNNEYLNEYRALQLTIYNDTLQNRVNLIKNNINAKIEFLRSMLGISALYKNSLLGARTIQKENIPLDKTKIFVVHGHDDVARLEICRFVEKLGFEPIVLHEQPNSGKTIIEKIESYSDVGFGIILYTPCDIGSKDSINPTFKSRARQNVVFEHGYLIGKIGRNNVTALVKDDVETPSDISGVVYISMNNNWKLILANELRSSGYPVDLNKIF